MSKLPKRTAHFDKIERKIIVSDNIRNAIENYKEVMCIVYRDISEIILNDKHIALKVIPNDSFTLADRIERCDYIEALAQHYSKSHGVNVVIVRLAIKHIFDLLKEYSNHKGNALAIHDYWNCAKQRLMQEIDVAISIKTINGTNTYKINLGRINSNEKKIDNCVWYWHTIHIDHDIDADSIRSVNTQQGQDVSKPSQHRETSRLVINDDGTIKIEINMKKELPIAYPHGGIMAIDVGLNRFLTILSYSLSDNKGKSIIVEDQDLLNRYKDAIKIGNILEIESAIVAIQDKIVEELNRVIIEMKPKYIVIENIGEGLEKTESTWTNSFPWIRHQELLSNTIAAKGVYVIWINPHGTSGCHAYSDDTIVRDNSNHSVGHCLLRGEKVDCDKNAVLNILSRGIIKILIKFVLEDKVSEIKEYADKNGLMLNELNYAAAKTIIEFCKEGYGLNLSVI